MIALYLIISILFVGLLLYTIFGGADFGGGILEVIKGRSEIKVISKAIAPVWEANHVWLILVIVIIFMGFPEVYAVLSNALHIPLFIMLLGIIFRGTAFTFRYYDVHADQNKFYTLCFRIGSIITPLFLGIILGAVTSGEIIIDYTSGFYAYYIAPWTRFFPFTVGIFTIVLFAYLAAVFLSGEAEVEQTRRMQYAKLARILLLAIVGVGGLVLLSSYFIPTNFLLEFLKSEVSIIVLVLATLSIPVMWKKLKALDVFWTRLLAGFQVTAIMIGWFAIQFPVMVYIKNAEDLTVFNTSAEQPALNALVWALIIGIILIFPSLIFLYRVFKGSAAVR